jgi:hypothetical protein
MRLQEQSRRGGRPAWWVLYVIGALMIAVVGLVEVFVDGERSRKVFETLAVVAGFGVTRIWVRFNRIAFGAAAGAAPRMMLTSLTVLVPY